MNFRDNIKFILEQKGMTQVDLAKKLGVTPQNLYITLSHNPTVASLERFAEALNTKASELIADPPLRQRGCYREKGEPTESSFTCPCCGARIKVKLTE